MIVYVAGFTFNTTQYHFVDSIAPLHAAEFTTPFCFTEHDLPNAIKHAKAAAEQFSIDATPFVNQVTFTNINDPTTMTITSIPIVDNEPVTVVATSSQ